MAIVPTLNLYLNYNNPSQPVFISAASTALARGIQVTGGEKVTFNVYLVDTTGASPTYVVPESGDTIRFSAKENANDEALSYLFDTWTIDGNRVTCTANFATVEGFWTTSDGPAKSLIANFEVETAAGLVRKWSFFLQIVHQSYGGEAPPVNPGETYVKYTAQTPTSEQQAQARANIGAGTSSFDPTAPGPIGGTTPGEITTTNFTLGTGGTDPLIAGDVNAGTATYMGGHNFRQGASFGSTGQTTIDASGGGSFTSISVGGSTLSLGGNNVTFGTWAAGFVQAESSADAIAALGLGPTDAVSFDAVTATTIEAGTLTATAGASVVGGFQSDTISAASGTFTVGSAGNVNGTHFKANGTGGEAGHNLLKQGTTPSGTAGYTTLWGISGGIGWRDGTGTAYSLTLPSASGTLALVSGALGTPSSITLTNATGLTVTGGGTGASTAFVARSNLGLSRMTPIHGGDGSWVTATVSGTVGTNTYFGGTRTGQIASATAGFGRFYYNAANSSNPYTGTRSTVNWSTPFRVSFRAQFYVNTNASSKVTVIIATGTATAAHDLAAVGLAIQAYGNGTGTFIRVQSHNGTSSSNGTAVAITAGDDTFYDFELVWTPGTSAVLYRDDVSLCSTTTTLATGNGASGATCFMGLFENGAGAADVSMLRLMYFNARR